MKLTNWIVKMSNSDVKTRCCLVRFGVVYQRRVQTVLQSDYAVFAIILWRLLDRLRVEVVRGRIGRSDGGPVGFAGCVHVGYGYSALETSFEFENGV